MFLRSKQTIRKKKITEVAMHPTVHWKFNISLPSVLRDMPINKIISSHIKIEMIHFKLTLLSFIIELSRGILSNKK